MLNVWRLVADAHCHDHLVIAIGCSLPIVALQQVCVGLPKVTVKISVGSSRCGAVIDFLLQLGPSFEHPLMALCLEALFCTLGAIQRHNYQAHHAGLRA